MLVGIFIYIYIQIYIYTYIYVPIFTILPYVTIYILTNANLHNLINNLLIFFLCGCGYKNDRFIVNINQRPNDNVTAESFEVNFLPDMVTKQFNASSSNEICGVIFFQTGN